MEETVNSNEQLTTGISIILCTYNGASRLEETIRHLCQQQVPAGLAWEVIFVDNASSDNSSAIAQAAWDKHQSDDRVPLTIFREDKPAKYYALQTGIAHARYEFFIICDDDNWFDPHYIQRMYTQLIRHPEAGAVGGQGAPATEGNAELPTWFTEYSEGYAVGKQGAQTGDVTKRGYLWGAGLGSRTALYRAIYAKYPSFLFYHDDRSILTTEDTEYCLRLVLRGYRLFYDGDLRFKHLIPKEKLTRQYMESLYKKNHEGFIITGKYYLAIKLYANKRFQSLRHLRLRILTPVRLLLARSEKKRIREKTIMEYLFPNRKQPDVVTQQIKKFVNDEGIPKIVST